MNNPKACSGRIGRPRMLDLFCGAGGASMGYFRAGWDVIGVDIATQPHYPFPFIRADALRVPLRGYDAIHASPPCQAHSPLRALPNVRPHLDLVGATRARLVRSGIPYVIENVPGAPLRQPIILCGSMFNLWVRRHRLFETSFPVRRLRCDHPGQDMRSPGFTVYRYHSGRAVPQTSTVVGVYGRGQGRGIGEVEDWKRAMDIDWMVRDELAQAIPPAYTQYIGHELKAWLAWNRR